MYDGNLLNININIKYGHKKNKNVFFSNMFCKKLLYYNQSCKVFKQIYILNRMFSVFLFSLK